MATAIPIHWTTHPARGARVWRVAASVLLAHAAALVPEVSGYTPQSPKVRQMIERAIPFLDSEEDERLGARCLIALVQLKEGHGEDHARIAEAVGACKVATRRAAEVIAEDIYSTGLAIIFLSELDAEKYEPEIQKLLRSLEVRQKEGGGWGYPPEHPRYGRTGDTSMTQYAVLALWTARRHGMTVPDDVIVKACNWLLRTQDPSGAWSYQGKDPGPGMFQRVAQNESEIRHSLCAGALGSLYICGDLLGLNVSQPSSPDSKDKLPPALKPVGPSGTVEPPRRAAASGIDRAVWRRATSDANRWLAANFQIDPRPWPLYYLYALERCHSFRELAQGITDPEPAWYNQGVDHLAKTQSQDGSWHEQAGATVGTAFAVLFLTRSTQKAIQQAGYGEGRLTGGRGLPKSVARVRVKQGKIAAEPSGQSIADVLAVLEDPNHPDYDYVTEFHEDLTLSDEPVTRERQVARLRRLVLAGSYKARASAVRALSRRRNLDDVPYLIFALGDPDGDVQHEADRGLRLISRRLDGVGIPVPEGDSQALAARVEAWKQWYLSIRPDAEFLP